MASPDAPRRTFPYATTLLPTRLSIDPQAWVAPSAILRGAVTLGARSSVWYQAVVRGDLAPVVVGEDTNIQDGAILHVEAEGPAVVGSRVTIGHMAIVHAATIADDCIIAMGSRVLSGARVGRRSIVGAGAIVTEGFEVPERSLVLGVPARVVRSVTDDEIERIERNWSVYVAYANHHRDEESRRMSLQGDHHRGEHHR
jgi:carbonic anhydrase/acetyltransferase-like protein (isoleucine patch superfamily)